MPETLNLKGRNDKDKRSKWSLVTTLLRKQRILVRGLQETHLDEKEIENIRKMCPKIEILSNRTSKNRKSVAFVINKDLANNMTWIHKVQIEGRASRLTINVEKDRGLDIIVVYAPNSNNDKVKFFEDLKVNLEE